MTKVIVLKDEGGLLIYVRDIEEQTEFWARRSRLHETKEGFVLMSDQAIRAVLTRKATERARLEEEKFRDAKAEELAELAAD